MRARREGIVVALDPRTATVRLQRRSDGSAAATSAAARRCCSTGAQPLEAMNGGRQTNRHLDELIDEITVDCYDEKEQLQGFENAFDETPAFRCPGPSR